MGDKKHIALLHYTCHPVVGGVEEVMFQHAALLHRHGHSVSVFAGSGEKYTDDFPVEINPLLGSGHPEIIAAQRSIADRKDAIDLLTEQISDYLQNVLENTDILIAHNTLTMHYNLPLTQALHQLAGSGKTRLVSWNHDSPFFYDNYPHELDSDHWEILRNCSPHIRYITISEIRQKEFHTMCGSSMTMDVIPNGIDPSDFLRLDPVVNRIIQEKGLFESDLLLLHPARLHPRKNIELSIRVIKGLLDKGVDARLLLTGSYDPHEDTTFAYLQELKELARNLKVYDNIVFFADHLLQNDSKATVRRIIIRDLFQISDIMFMPSFQEGFGIPLLEAGLSRLPVVCSDIPPFREIKRDDICFFPLDSSPDEIASEIMGFTERLPLHRMFHYVVRNCRWDNIYQRKILPLLLSLDNT